MTIEQKLDRIIQLLERIAHVEKPVTSSYTYYGGGSGGGNAGGGSGKLLPGQITSDSPNYFSN